MKAEDAAKVVLGEGGAGLDAYKDPYSGFDQHMAAYRYHFLTHSKPATHLRAFAHLDEEALETGMPETYRELLNHVTDGVTPIGARTPTRRMTLSAQDAIHG